MVRKIVKAKITVCLNKLDSPIYNTEQIHDVIVRYYNEGEDCDWEESVEYVIDEVITEEE